MTTTPAEEEPTLAIALARRGDLMWVAADDVQRRHPLMALIGLHVVDIAIISCALCGSAQACIACTNVAWPGGLLARVLEYVHVYANEHDEHVRHQLSLVQAGKRCCL